MSDELRKKLMNCAVQANIALGVALANRLNLFEAIAKVGTEKSPAHFEEIAKIANLKPRYTKELLAILACSEIIEVMQDGEHFYIPKESQEVLAPISSSEEEIKDKSLSLCSFVPLHASVFENIAKVIEKDGPLGMDYSNYSDFYGIMDQFSIALHKKHLIPDLIPLTGMKEKLIEGIQFLDVGCGSGFHICELAKAFPKSHFTGIDLTDSAISKANERKSQMLLPNVEFFQQNAKSMNSEWSTKFDMVMIFDACHDQCRPDLAVKEIYRVLKDGGIFAMIEIDGTSNIFEDKQTFGPAACAFYSASVFHCLAVGSNSEDALGMGTMMGTKKGTKLLNDAGFENVKVLKVPFFDFNVLYLAKK
jgi:ubiquinone/menaquinone biosynthesis C-methylase UbiE